MTAKFKQIIDSLNGLVTFKVDRSMPDDDFIANVDAVNVLCNLYDDLGLDRTGIRKNMDKIYPHFFRRIYGKKKIQHAMPLIKALYRYIYGRGVDDRGPAEWWDSYVEMCVKVVDSYRKKPLIHSADYLFALDTVCRMSDTPGRTDIMEYKDTIAAYLGDIDNVPTAEKIRRVRAYWLSHFLFTSDKWEKWAEVRESLKYEDAKRLDDEDFLIWCGVTDESPREELKRRAGNSKRMQVEYHQYLIFAEFKKQRHLTARRKLSRELKRLNDDIIGDILDIKIDANMTVSELHALETIYYLRLQLAEVSGDDKMAVYRNLCRSRYEEITKVLTAKYPTATTLNEKIEILERLQDMELHLRSDYSDFALEEASNLEDSPGLTYSQRLRLAWLTGIDAEDCIQTIATLLTQAKEAFDIATLSQIQDFGTDEDRKAIFGCFAEMFTAALKRGDSAELSKLLTTAAYWNINTAKRQVIANLSVQTETFDELSLPERRVNAIAAEIYARIDALTGRYEDFDNIPA